MCKCTAVRARVPSKPPPLPAFLYASLPLCRDRKNSFFASAVARWCQSCEAHVAQLCCKREAGVLYPDSQT